MSTQSSKRQKAVLQPAEIFKRLKVPHTDENERILDLALKLIAYLPVGDEIRCGDVRYHRLDEDTVHVATKLTNEGLVETLAKKRIIRIPT